MPNELLVTTSAGNASVVVDTPTGEPRGLVVLTHGAGGGIETLDLHAVRDAAVARGAVVARVNQPYVVAGRRMPPRPPVQDPAWIEVILQLRQRFPGPLVQGGRSNGARVACRTATSVEAVGVLALAFPLHPPGKPENSRVEELRGAGVPVIVVNGANDPFGIPDAGDAQEVHVLPGEAHSFKKSRAEIRAAVDPWLERWLS
ncbi:alpha/beta family hydrolase [Smaragdicoccus niigatensis]|uniref:alpha/beta hydrolase family protein n=1 Tax=Smaragdicoccus niigatensis TaxID=359359 RepID=UPI00037CAC90|nr:alpha/beta family hydrolase [Smaragdicoccus niigatensis]